MTITGINENFYNSDMPLKEGATAYSILSETGLSYKKTGFGSATYVRAINGLAEKDHGPLSGWMYKVNGVAPNISAGGYKLKKGLLSAFNIASRIGLQALPNVKPVTSIIILSVILFGLSFAFKVTVVTTVVSNIFLGMGIWTFFQILAWFVICILTEILVDLFHIRENKPHYVLMACFSFVMGYVFGFVVSLDQFVIGGLGLFIPYYVGGLLFDTFHAVGNFFFYLMLAPILYKIFEKDLKKSEQN